MSLVLAYNMNHRSAENVHFGELGPDFPFDTYNAILLLASCRSLHISDY